MINAKFPKLAQWRHNTKERASIANPTKSITKIIITDDDKIDINKLKYEQHLKETVAKCWLCDENYYRRKLKLRKFSPIR